MKLTNGHRWLLMLVAATLIAACADDDAGTGDIIRFRADVWQVMEGTRAKAPARSLSRATTYNGGTLTSGSFSVAAYTAGSTTTYFSPTTVNWDNGKWVFADGKHYWPATGALDFFAYMPATKPDYITSISYTTARNPQFTCSLPMTGSEPGTISEFVCALTTGQDKTSQGSTGVSLTFKHPFARLNFQLSGSHPDITIETITFKSLKSGGTCSFDVSTSTWSSLTPADKTVDFVATINQECHDNTAAVPLGSTYLVVPQTFAGDITVKAKWTDWGEQISHNVSTTLPSSINWQAGYSYTYTFTITETDLIVRTDKFTEQW